MKDLENSRLDRENVLNNKYAVEILEKDLDFKGYLYNSEICFLKEDVVKIFEADVRTIERIIESNYEELVEISSYETGIAYEIEQKFNTGKVKLSKEDVEKIIYDMFNHPINLKHAFATN